jgi:hypothetical protein
MAIFMDQPKQLMACTAALLLRRSTVQQKLGFCDDF